MQILSFPKPDINERVISEMERLLERSLTPEEIRLILLAHTVKKDLESGSKDGSKDQDAA